MPQYSIPSPSARFRPRADEGLLSRLVQDAWKEYDARLLPAEENERVGYALAKHLEGLYPPKDMDVLKRYGCAREANTVHVHIYDPESERWDHGASVALPCPLLTPDRGASLYCGGPRWSEVPGHGLTESYRDELSDEEFETYLEDHRQREKSMCPLEVESYFDAIVVARKLFSVEYKESTAWAQKKGPDGKYPTWTEIEERFTVLGGYLRRCRELVV